MNLSEKDAELLRGNFKNAMKIIRKQETIIKKLGEKKG